MTFPIQRTSINGNILKLSNGKIAGSCCCGTGTTCVGLSCGAIDCGGEPSMNLTVTADDADLPVTWCGKTWVKSTTTITDATTQAYSGCSMCVCPTFVGSFPPSTFGGSNYFGYYSYVFGTGATSLNLLRKASNSTFISDIRNLVSGRAGAFKNAIYFVAGVTTPTSSSAVPASFTPLNGAPKPFISSASNSVNVTDHFFSNVTISSVNYKWEKGLGWP